MFWFWRKKKPSTAEAKLADKDVRDAVAGYQRFRQQFATDRTFYQKLAEKQEPNLLWIGCSDSRVIPDIITASDPGRLFVVRNIGNIVPPAGSGDNSVGAAVEYAILQLGIDDIVICGHIGCGGVKAMQQGLPGAETHLHRWVESGAPSLPKGLSELDAVKRNILAQRDNLLTYSVVRQRVEKGALNIHEWLYDMSDGQLLAYDSEADSWRPLAGAAD